VKLEIFHNILLFTLRTNLIRVLKPLERIMENNYVGMIFMIKMVSYIKVLAMKLHNKTLLWNENTKTFLTLLGA